MNQTSIRRMILGATASGKSALGVALAEEIGGEILSVDSRQCFRGVPVGTAQPTADQQRRVPHHNVACLDPDQKESVAAFTARRHELECQIREREHSLLYVGGSTLHLQSILQPLDPLPPANPNNLEQLEERIKSEGIESLFQELHRVDPVTATRMDGYNSHRILRALDVWMQTGRPIHTFHTQDRRSITPPDDLIVFGLHWPRPLLHRRIEERVDRMVASGLLEETQALMDRGVPEDAQIMTSVGYREIRRVLTGEWSLDDAVTAIKTATRRYAKRQLTWFRPWSFVHWLDASEIPVETLVRKVLDVHPNKGSSSS